MPKIEHLFEFVDGDFDTEKGEIVCVSSIKHACVDLCFRSNFNIPFARIKLHSKDRYADAHAVFGSAKSLGDEMVKRWTLYPALKANFDARNPISDMYHWKWLPPEYIFCATNKSGHAHAFTHDPQHDEDTWFSDVTGHKVWHIGIAQFDFGDWKESKRARPF